MSRKPLRVIQEIGRSQVARIKILADRCSTNCCEIDLTVVGRKAPVRVCFIRTDRGIRKLGRRNLSRELFDYCFADIALKVMNPDGLFLAQQKRKEVEREALNMTDEQYAEHVRLELEKEAEEARSFATDNGLGASANPFADDAPAPPRVRIRKMKAPKELPLFPL